MTAVKDETQCACHWGSEEELELLKTPDVELDLDLLRRTWSAPDWNDHGAVLRRVLPQLARALVGGHVQRSAGMHEVGHSFSRGLWQQWPAHQSTVVREFLHAWWENALNEPSPVVPVHEALALCAEASDALRPWLHYWETLDHRVADQHLAAAAAHWEYDLLAGQLPWTSMNDDADAQCVELASWLARHAPTRLRLHDVSEELLHRIRLLGLTGRARWEDPHWPGDRY
ncbi:hypothetical protein [Streptomyces sp. NPDC051561]|uniref:hypothetical protein n=1 Tax=Streptomyces sp. NPDC051561 TaxID=3365658 RepID=UPI003789803B